MIYKYKQQAFILFHVREAIKKRSSSDWQRAEIVLSVRFFNHEVFSPDRHIMRILTNLSSSSELVGQRIPVGFGAEQPVQDDNWWILSFTIQLIRMVDQWQWGCALIPAT